MASSISVQQYIKNQPKYTTSRRILRWMIRQIGFRFLAKVTVSGIEHVPTTGPTILMMNHISAIDPVICLGVVTDRFVIPMTKIENTKNPILALTVKLWGAYTVDRGTVDRKALLNSIELLNSGQMILIAPEGTRHPEGLQTAKNGMTYIATKTDAIILPTALSGSQHFKSRWKSLRRAQVHVSFGRPFRLKTDGRARIPRDELALMTKETMYQLALAQQDPTLRGVYSDVENATTDTVEFI